MFSHFIFSLFLVSTFSNVNKIAIIHWVPLTLHICTYIFIPINLTNPMTQKYRLPQVNQLPRENPMDRGGWIEEAGGLQSIGLQSQTQLKWLSTNAHKCWEPPYGKKNELNQLFCQPTLLLFYIPPQNFLSSDWRKFI